MHRIDRSVLVPYSAERMFRLVEQVDGYPEFLPWCPASSVRQLADGSVQATIEIAYLGVRSRFTTRNVSTFPGEIRMSLIEGPFRRLDGHWSFRELGPHACKVGLQLQYHFAAGMLGRVVAPVFDKIAASLVDAFARRAEALYGTRPA